MKETNIHDKFTCKVKQFSHAPKKTRLTGNKRNGAESAQHIIEFPGGAIEVSRTSNNEYWAHIIVNTGQVIDDCEGLCSAHGEIVGSRIDYQDKIVEIENQDRVQQIAIRIKVSQ